MISSSFRGPIDENIIWHSHPVNQQDRERLHKHHALVLWFTGLSGSGKSTLAGALEQALHHKGISTYLLDGDNMRHGLCCDLGFSADDRRENVRRVGEVASLMVDAGLIVLAALIAPYRTDRQMLREILPVGRFIEVFVDTPMKICNIRDPKGLYKQALDGKLNHFPGINSVYEPPQNPDVHLDGQELVKHLIGRLLVFIKDRLMIG